MPGPNATAPGHRSLSLWALCRSSAGPGTALSLGFRKGRRGQVAWGLNWP